MAALASASPQISSDRLDLTQITSGNKSSTGIPEVKFFEDVDEFASTFKPKATAEFLIGAFSELFRQFKLFETNLERRKLNFQTKIPEIEKTLGLVKFLREKREKGDKVSTQYNICDTVYAKADIVNDGSVNLWLGVSNKRRCLCCRIGK